MLSIFFKFFVEILLRILEKRFKHGALSDDTKTVPFIMFVDNVTGTFSPNKNDVDSRAKKKKKKKNPTTRIYINHSPGLFEI